MNNFDYFMKKLEQKVELSKDDITFDELSFRDIDEIIDKVNFKKPKKELPKDIVEELVSVCKPKSNIGINTYYRGYDDENKSITSIFEICINQYYEMKDNFIDETLSQKKSSRKLLFHSSVQNTPPYTIEIELRYFIKLCKDEGILLVGKDDDYLILGEDISILFMNYDECGKTRIPIQLLVPSLKKIIAYCGEKENIDVKKYLDQLDRSDLSWEIMTKMENK